MKTRINSHFLIISLCVAAAFSFGACTSAAPETKAAAESAAVPETTAAETAIVTEAKTVETAAAAETSVAETPGKAETSAEAETVDTSANADAENAGAAENADTQENADTAEAADAQENADTAEAAGTQENADTAGAAPEENLELSFEVKYLLDSGLVLDEEGLLTEEFTSWFSLEEYRPIDVLYLETEDNDFLREGWINRLRWKEGKKKAERAYKKRYTANGDGADCAALLIAQAAEDGFDIASQDLEPEFDWSYSKMTLSFTGEKSGVYADHKNLADFSTEDAIAFMEETMPPAEDNWKSARWGTDTLQKARMIGPLRTLRIKGDWEGLEITIEIWPIPMDGTDEVTYITELSFKADDMHSAAETRKRMMEYLDGKGVLLHENSLKTQLVLGME